MFKQTERKTITVHMCLVDGTRMHCEIICGLTPQLSSILNGDDQFIEIHHDDGKTQFVSKKQILSVEPKVPLNLPKLNMPSSATTAWHQILKVDPESQPIEVKKAYHRLAKDYHPDRFGENMPSEMRQYANDMFGQISAAYSHYCEISGQQQNGGKLFG